MASPDVTPTATATTTTTTTTELPASPPPQPKPTTITHLSTLLPSSLERSWLTAPHPTLPLVATCSADKTVRIYSLRNFRLLSTISGGHKRSVRSCAWKPQPQTQPQSTTSSSFTTTTTGGGGVRGESVLATGSFDATVGIWRRWDSYGREMGYIDSGDDEMQATHPDTTTQLQQFQEERDEGGDDDDEEWRFAVLLDGHDSEVKSVSWSSSGIYLATCSRDKSIWIWEDLDDGDNNFETVAVMQEHGGDVKCVAWHPVEECLASASYDDTIRVWREDVDDWGQVACIRGHAGTVWFIDWEGIGTAPSIPTTAASASSDSAEAALRQRWKTEHALSGPRLVSCSDDRTVRVWRRQAKPSTSSAGPGSGATIPSIIRPTGTDETWVEDAVLPAVHDLSVYSVAWSKTSGLVASVGADGRIVVYKEQFASRSAAEDGGSDMDMDMDMHTAMAKDTTDEKKSEETPSRLRTEWTIFASIAGAHGIYEINHVAWAKRADKGKQEGKDEEVLVTTADDGSVKVWTLSI